MYLIVLFSLCEIMSCIPHSVKESINVRLGSSYKPSHPLLKHSEDGAYFQISNDTITPHCFMAFSNDGVVSCGTLYNYTYNAVYSIENDSIYVQFINWWYPGFPIKSYSAAKVGCKILNDSTIQYTYMAGSQTYTRTYIFQATNRPINVTSTDDMRNYSWMWKSRKERRAWKMANRRK